jgi:hypothetical protein
LAAAAENELRDDVEEPYTALLRQAVRVAANLADQPQDLSLDPSLDPSLHPSPAGASLPENENP